MMRLKNNLNIHFIILLFIGITGVSCKGPEGPVGPQGPQGEEGPQGPQGEEGTANVMYSEWRPADWNYFNEPDQKIMFIEEERVAGEFMDTGTLLVYFQSPGSGTVQALPYANYTLSIQPIIVDREIGGVDYKGIFIAAEQRDGTINPPPLPNWVDDIQIRFVLIPDGVAAKVPAGFFKDYHNLSTFLGIN